MPKIDFEGIAPANGFAFLPNGYAGFKWKSAGAADADGIDNAQAVLQSGRDVGILGVDGKAKMRAIADDFDLVDGHFTSLLSGGSTMKVKAFDDGVRVAKMRIELTDSDQLVTFSNQFSSLDKVVFKNASAWTDDLQVEFISAAKAAADDPWG